MSLLTQNNIEIKKESNELFPVFLKLQNFRTLLVGAGNVGLEKLEAMLNNSPKANITVVGDRVLVEVKELLQNRENVQLFERKFEEQDLFGVELVILATDDKALHQYIREIAKEKGLLVNVADTPDLCDFYLGSIVKKGNLKIAISTNGKSPTVAKRIKQIINESLPEEIDETLDQMSKLRDTLKGNFAYKVRKMNEATAALVDEKIKTNKWDTRKVMPYIIIGFLALIGLFTIINLIFNLGF
jgi:siroheme synthase-like protein